MNSEITVKNARKRGLFSKQVAFSAQQNRILNIFFYTVLAGTFVAMLGIILYYVYAYAALSSGNHAFDWLLGIFSDFVYIMNVSLEESPYLIEDSSYPPIAIIVLYPFALICKGVFAQYANQVLTVDQLTSKVILHAEFWIAMIIFFVVCSALIILIVTREYSLPPVQAIKIGIIILTSAPFVYAVMRGNTIYFAMIFLLLFLLLYKSDNAILRELGYISLVLAGLIKIYPLFFGVFLLCKKKIWASARVAIYTFAFFGLSFLLLDRGMSDLLPFITNLGEFASNDLRLIAGNNLSISSILYKLCALLSIKSAFGAINIIALVAVFAVSTLCAVYTKSDFSRYVIAAAIVILIPSISYFYVLIFTLLPFMQFIKNYDDMSEIRKKLYTVLFIVIFFTPAILPKYFILQSLAVIVMLVFECKEVFKNELLKPKEAKAAASA